MAPAAVDDMLPGIRADASFVIQSSDGVRVIDAQVEQFSDCLAHYLPQLLHAICRAN